MQIERNGLLVVLSEALDSIEEEILGVKSNHALRVAVLSTRMGRRCEMTEAELSDLAVAALLHDSALNECRSDYENGAIKQGYTGQAHCIAGEENLALIPGVISGYGFVKYHHESADGTGPFGKTEKETPLGAQMIHIANEVDLRFALGTCSELFLPDIRIYVKENTGSLFGEEVAAIFLEILDEECLKQLSDEHIGLELLELEPVWTDIKEEKVHQAAELFARIIDYKSPFTSRHSVGIAQKAEIMSRFYHYDDETAAKFYIAGALHDIGKLKVLHKVLEKPGSLEEKEYRHIQTHAYETWRMLSKIKGFDDITKWASSHHEKLNGRGYPFGKMADELDEKDRLLAVLDIYQALTEDRPYKEGMTHEKTMQILNGMVKKGELDEKIVRDVDAVFGEKEGADS